MSVFLQASFPRLHNNFDSQLLKSFNLIEFRKEKPWKKQTTVKKVGKKLLKLRKIEGSVLETCSMIVRSYLNEALDSWPISRNKVK